MKRYALFSGSNYYPGGGWDDFVDSFDTFGDAFEEGKRRLDRNKRGYRDDWFQIIDLHTGERVDG